jgi:hypothetical protein
MIDRIGFVRIMNPTLKCLFPILCVVFIISALSLPVFAPNGDLAHLVVEPQTVNVAVSNDFDVEIWIRNLKLGPMVGFDFTVSWDPTMMEYKSHVINSNGWSGFVEHLDLGGGHLNIGIPQDSNPPISGDAKWLTITFHCLDEGTSTIGVSSIDTIWIQQNGQIIGIDPELFEGTVNQIAPQSVGGYMVSVNKIALLAPYIAIAVLLSATIFYITKDSQIKQVQGSISKRSDGRYFVNLPKELVEDDNFPIPPIETVKKVNIHFTPGDDKLVIEEDMNDKEN